MRKLLVLVVITLALIGPCPVLAASMRYPYQAPPTVASVRLEYLLLAAVIGFLLGIFVRGSVDDN